MSMRPYDPNFQANQPSEDCLDNDKFRLTKRQMLSSPVTSPAASQPSFFPHDLFYEPKPLGLKLTKSASLLEMINMRLSGAAPVPVENGTIENKGDAKETQKASSERIIKHKATDFNAIYLRIGSWEFTSRFDGDLVTKCYFGRKKLVWEILECGKKLKMEILCSDIIGLKGNYPSGSLGNMIIMLARPPLFYKEISPPRKYTVWELCSDFTNGQASFNRTHVLQFRAKVLRKLFEKLLGSDPRLNMLSQQPQLPVDSPFVQTFNSFELCNAQASPVSSLRDRASSSLSMDSSSPTLGMDANIFEGNGYASQSTAAQTLNTAGLHHSASATDLMNGASPISSYNGDSSYSLSHISGSSEDFFDGLPDHIASFSDFLSSIGKDGGNKQ